MTLQTGRHALSSINYHSGTKKNRKPTRILHCLDPSLKVSISSTTNLSSSASLASSCSILCNLSLSTLMFSALAANTTPTPYSSNLPPSGITDVGRKYPAHKEAASRYCW